MRVSSYKTLAACLMFAAAAPAPAQGPGNSGNTPARPSDAVPSSNGNAFQTGRPVDPDQGDDHASQNAIDKVCNKDTPAAERSAICPGPISRG